MEEQLKELEDRAPKDTPDPAANMLLRVQGVYDILVSDSFTSAQKNEALKQIVDKIVYEREQDSYISKIPANHCKIRACGFFIRCSKKVDTVGLKDLR